MRLFLIKIILFICAYLPLPVIHAIGVGIGWGLILIPNRSRSSSEINIARCLPELSAREQRALLRKSLLETGKTIIETSALWFRSGERSLRLIRRVDGNQQVEQAIAAGSGVILATPHLGSWEAAGLYGSARFGTVSYTHLRAHETNPCISYAVFCFGDLQRTVEAGNSELGRAIQAGRLPGTQVRCSEDHTGTRCDCLLNLFIPINPADQAQRLFPAAKPQCAGFDDGLAGFQQTFSQQCPLFAGRQFWKAARNIDFTTSA